MRAWLEAKRGYWETEAGHCRDIIEKRQRWITELELAKTWSEEQRQLWEAESSTRQGLIERQRG